MRVSVTGSLLQVVMHRRVQTLISSSSLRSFPTNTGTSLASTTPSVPGLMCAHISIAWWAFLLA